MCYVGPYARVGRVADRENCVCYWASAIFKHSGSIRVKKAILAISEGSIILRGLTVASSPGPLSQLFNVARNKARGEPGTRHHARDTKGRFEVESI